MNERIEELAKYCGYNGDYCTEDFSLEMFAELIVRECSELTLDYKSEAYYNGWLDYRDLIKQHFGVE